MDSNSKKNVPASERLYEPPAIYSWLNMALHPLVDSQLAMNTLFFLRQYTDHDDQQNYPQRDQYPKPDISVHPVTHQSVPVHTVHHKMSFLMYELRGMPHVSRHVIPVSPFNPTGLYGNNTLTERSSLVLFQGLELTELPFSITPASLSKLKQLTTKICFDHTSGYEFW